MKIALFSSKSYDTEYFEVAGKHFGHEITHFETRLRARTAYLAAGHEAVCVFVNDVVDRETIDVLKDLGILAIALRCAGFNNVDLIAAEETGIRVVRVPAYSPESVAEHALALILTLNRKTHKSYNRVREGNFSLEWLAGYWPTICIRTKYSPNREWNMWIMRPCLTSQTSFPCIVRLLLKPPT